jgi:hypothetical protein
MIVVKAYGASDVLDCAAYCAKKAALEQERAEAAAAKAAAKEAQRQKMRDAMEENYKRWHQNTEDKVARDVQEAQDKAAAAAEAQRTR